MWWDIRPNIEYGTIEVRIADCPPTTKEVESIVALIHSLAVYIDKELALGRKFPPPPEWILRENKWRASRHGVQADLIADPKGTSIPFLEMWQGLRKSIRSVERSFCYEPLLNFLDTVIQKGPSYFRQRLYYENGPDGVIRHLVREGENDQPEWRTL